MEIAPFELERWFAEHEAGNLMLAESGVRPLDPGRFDLVPDDLGYVIPTGGDPALRERVGERYGRDADGVLFTCGTQEANFVTMAALVGEHAVVVTPTYQSLHAVPEAFGEVTRVELDPPRWRLDPDRVADAVRPDTAVVVLNNPNNPTGRVHPRATVEAVYDLAADAGAYLLSDEVYRPLAPDAPRPVASMGTHGISTCGLSKGYGLAGLRFGWLAGPPAVVEAAWEWKDYTTISPPAVAHRVAEQVFADEEAVLTENRTLAADHREVVADWIDRHGLDWYAPDAGVNAFVRAPGGDGRAFCERAVAEAGVVLAPGDAFGVPDRFRLGFGLPGAELDEGLDRLDALLS